MNFKMTYDLSNLKNPRYYVDGKELVLINLNLKKIYVKLKV